MEAAKRKEREESAGERKAFALGEKGETKGEVRKEKVTEKILQKIFGKPIDKM